MWEGVATFLIGGPVDADTLRKEIEILGAITAFWHTFSQKINSYGCAKYDTFPSPAVLHAPSNSKTGTAGVLATIMMGRRTEGPENGTKRQTTKGTGGNRR